MFGLVINVTWNKGIMLQISKVRSAQHYSTEMPGLFAGLLHNDLSVVQKTLAKDQTFHSSKLLLVTTKS